MKNNKQRYLSIADIAGKFDVSEQTVIEWIKIGKIKATYFNQGKWDILESQFRTTSEQDHERRSNFKKLWNKRDRLPEENREQ
ncbi:hypothetical protein LPY66_04560 [Dehalobacter sp. DCM]|uniref:hypothetical protein n=1 Tax=Dehalobacter sp. DCM TaxID=2907827 RepID=UPI003081750E|nr:hypothetical protein LPY66_04560 [Dehalobacter sp. DCM]